jgi:hypothetical protein
MEIPVELQGTLKQSDIYVIEACDRCGRLLGPVRFTHAGDSGVWCSRQCRDGAHAHLPGTCRACGARLCEGKRRGAKYCDDACKQAAHRSKTDARPSETAKLSVKKPVLCGFFISGMCGSSHGPSRGGTCARNAPFTFRVRGGMKGRKRKVDSRATELRQRLIVWQQTPPDYMRPPLRVAR